MEIEEDMAVEEDCSRGGVMYAGARHFGWWGARCFPNTLRGGEHDATEREEEDAAEDEDFTEVLCTYVEAHTMLLTRLGDECSGDGAFEYFIMFQ